MITHAMIPYDWEAVKEISVYGVERVARKTKRCTYLKEKHRTDFRHHVISFIRKSYLSKK
jgi:hypothetical protein